MADLHTFIATCRLLDFTLLFRLIYCSLAVAPTTFTAPFTFICLHHGYSSRLPVVTTRLRVDFTLTFGLILTYRLPVVTVAPMQLLVWTFIIGLPLHTTFPRGYRLPAGLQLLASICSRLHLPLPFTS